ncbi:type II toxin-antitoxin system RelE/ParE family toxin [Nostocaceae cyanobacterium CENA369]|uniref:Type II toxin-antitoxin system RelE/ParE family toxin n=1 Tax=Dendronalium phyllosphericum CENA369 TaxID=1725256 RepID=A0A8J7I413_9NOST|nr:type II toxin-antitoxin system RelE/ParE family toxin [Dendronalium phyllosphericum]MBH8573323.1 type II toxin-antitoxin system RelE/ParE family toxin [Dendronalium phyllosphericum CENA369]
MARVSWTSEALTDLEAIGDFIARDAPSFTQIFVDRVFQSVERLEQFPRSGRVVPEIAQENLREVVFGSYRIVYLVSGDEVNILTVFHSSKQLQL